MKVSVAIATFRGSRFITEQLASIVEQTLPPDEIIVFDDASDDDTVEAAESFARSCSVPISIHRNESNVGVVANFESAIKATDGDVIFLADQDDVWYPHKIITMVDAFASDPDTGLLFSDADLVNQDLRPLGRSLWSELRFKASERRLIQSPSALDLLLRRFLVTGATLAIRRELLPILLPFSQHLIHDAWIATLASSITRIGVIDKPLIQYRQHANQRIGTRASWRNWWTQLKAAQEMTPEYFDEQQLFYQDLATRLEDCKSQWLHPGIGDLADRKVQHLRRRIHFRQQRLRSVISVSREYLGGDYSRFSVGWKSAAQDLLL